MKTSHYFIPIRLAKVKKYGSFQFGLECGEMDIVILYFWWKYKLFHFEEQFGGCQIESVCTPSGSSYTSSQGTGTKMVFAALLILTNFGK